MSATAPSGAYSAAFYDTYGSASQRSAVAVLDLLRSLGLGPWPRVIDVGCGRGAWLRACRQAGSETTVGIDGPWNADAFEASDPIEFHAYDLAAATHADLTSLGGNRRFDLAISVEALEHLPPAAGAGVVQALVSWSDLVVFSAAIPGQGGREHQNEQWQSHWAAEFARYGYAPYDIVRPAVWSRDDVEAWYRQNVLVYAPSPPRPGLDPAREGFLDLVHPELFARRRLELSPSELARATRGLARRRGRGALRRLGI